MIDFTLDTSILCWKSVVITLCWDGDDRTSSTRICAATTTFGGYFCNQLRRRQQPVVMTLI